MLFGPRIVIVGSTGSGKTALARRLGETLQLPHIELDAIHWGADWTPLPDFADRVRAIIATEQWVLEGNYRAVRDSVWSRATTIVWLNYSFARTLLQVTRRSFRRALWGERLWNGNRESFRRAFLHRDGPMLWLMRSYHRRRREYPVDFARFPQATVIELRHPRETEAFIQRVRNGA